MKKLSKRQLMVERALGLNDGPTTGGLEDRLRERFQERQLKLAEIRKRNDNQAERA